jgi:uncharacterized protein (TIGR03435 family)
MRHPSLYRSTLLPLLLSIPAGAIPARAQQPAAPTPFAGKSFEIVSIRQNVSQGDSGPRDLVAAPDGFRVVRQPLMMLLLTAYSPEAGGMFLNRIENMPDWAQRSRYDFDGRISDADRAAWNDPKNQPAMLQAALQSALQDRLKIVVHREYKTVPVYELVVAKSGTKFTETKPDEHASAEAILPGGGRMGQNPDGATHFSNFTMGLLAGLLTSKSDRPVLDKTGLTGRYTLDVHEPQQMAAPSASSNGESEDERRPAVADALKSAGLELKSSRQPVEYLVIDHIEKPTEN